MSPARAAGALLALLVLGACAGPATAPEAGADAARDAERAPVVPQETADPETLARLADLAALPLPRSGRLAQASSEDRGGGGPYPALLERGNRDMNHFVCLGAAGSDVREPGLLPNTYDLPACPEPYLRGAVLARFEGSGALVRFWATLLSLRGATPPDRERFLVWVDDDPEPAIDVPLAGVLDGSASPIFAPPFGAGEPDRVAWYYPVVFAQRLVIALDGTGSLDLVYHQSTVLLDAAPVARRAPEGASPERSRAAAALGDGSVAGELRAYSGSVPPGARLDALVLDGAGTVRELRARAASREALRDLRIAIAYDGGPDVIELPLLELFAAALHPPSAEGFLLSGRLDGAGVELALRLPMPFAAGARIALANEGSAAVELAVEALVDPSPPDLAALRLHTERRETLAPAPGTHHPLASARGPGRLVGVCLMLEGHALAGAGAAALPLNFLEGDERIVVDASTELRGTGTEDYLDGAFYFERGEIVSPFAQAVAEADAGRASGCRWHVRTNAIDFSTSLEASLEIGPGDPAVLDRYRSVAFLYR